MTLKPDIVYQMGRFMYVAPSPQLNGQSKYVPLGTRTPTSSARDTRGDPQKVEARVFTASQSNEERIVPDTPSRSTSCS